MRITHGTRWKAAVVMAVVGLLGAVCAGADELAALAAREARQAEMEARIKQLDALVEDLVRAQELQQRRIGELQDEVTGLTKKLAAAEAAREQASAKWVDREAFAEFEEALKKSMADENTKVRELIVSKLGDLERKLAAAPVATPPPVVAVPPGPAPARMGYQHEVQGGENLSRILDAYNAEFESQGRRRVSLREVVTHPENASINADLIRPGQMIFIPEPPMRDDGD